MKTRQYIRALGLALLFTVGGALLAPQAAPRVAEAVVNVSVWPALGTTVTLQDGVTTITSAGAVVTYTSEIRTLISQGKLLTHDPRPGSTSIVDYPTSTITTAPQTVASLSLTAGRSQGETAAAQYYDTGKPGGGGLFRWDGSSTATVDNGVILGNSSVGRWFRIYTGPLDVRWYGATCDGVTDDTTAVQAAVDAGYNIGAAVYFPPGKTKVSSIGIRSGNMLIGAGYGTFPSLTNKSEISQLASAPGELIKRHASAGTSPIYNVTIRDLALTGVSGNGGTGLSLLGVQHSYFSNLVIAFFKNNADTGIGIYLMNSPTAGALGNAFDNIIISDCDDGIKSDEDPAASATAVGYNRFHGITVYQEKYAIRLLAKAPAHGAIYNTFSGVFLQGNSDISAKGIYVEGAGNAFVGVTADQMAGTNIECAASSSGNTFVQVNANVAKVVNNQSTGGYNTFIGPGLWSGGMNEPFYFSNQQTGDTQVVLQSVGSSNGPLIRYATDQSTSHYKTGVSSGAGSAYFFLNHYSAGTLQRWNNDGSSTLLGALTGNSATAIPSGGSTSVGFKFTSTSNLGIFPGHGAPTMSAAKGSIYVRDDGSSTSTRLYINTDGGTTWTPVTTGS